MSVLRFFLPLVALAAIVPYLGLNGFAMRMLILMGIYVILASSLNLLTGFTGLISLGHAAFYAIGAYTSALMSIKLELNYAFTATIFVLAAVFDSRWGYYLPYAPA